MNLIVNESGEVFFDSIRIGTVEIRKDKKCFVSYATYEKHIYRKLNAWTVNSEVPKIPGLQFILWNIPGQKTFGIHVRKLEKFMNKYNNYLRGFKRYKKFETQIAVPVTLCDSKIYGQDEIRKGIDVDKFESMIVDPHTVYSEWIFRRRSKTSDKRSWTV